MIIKSKDDVLSLSGSLHKNQWKAIKAAANLLLQEYPQGIIIDCSELEDISEGGARTFLDAMNDIEAAHSRIIVANLPEKVLSVCKSIPGVRSQLPIAHSIEEARCSLRLSSRTQGVAGNGKHGALLVVPLLGDMDLTYGAELAALLARAGHHEVLLVYFLEVARNLPLNAPMGEAEQAAQASLDQAHRILKTHNVPVNTHLEKVREASDGIVSFLKQCGAERVVLGVSQYPEQDEASEHLQSIVETLIKRAPCEVVIGRGKRK